MGPVELILSRYTLHLLFLLSLGLLAVAFLGAVARQALELWGFSPWWGRTAEGDALSPFARSCRWTIAALLVVALGFAVLIGRGEGAWEKAAPLLPALLYSLLALGFLTLFLRRQINEDNVLLFPLVATLNGIGLLMLYRLAVVADPRVPEIGERVYTNQQVCSLLGLLLMGLTVAALRIVALDNVHGDPEEVIRGSGHPGWPVRAIIGLRTYGGQLLLVLLAASFLLILHLVGHSLKVRAEGEGLAVGRVLLQGGLAGLMLFVPSLLRPSLRRAGLWEKQTSSGMWMVYTGLLLLLPLPFGDKTIREKMYVSLGPVQFQPGELAKLTLLFFLTFLLMDYRERMGGWTQPLSERFAFLRRPAFLIGLAFAGYFLERDIGPLLLYSLLILLLFFVGTSRLIEGLTILIFFIFLPIQIYNHWSYQINPWIDRLSSTSVDRINIWSNPWFYAKGEQIVRSLWAMKDGGLLGRGLGMGDPQLFHSQVHNDFIFSLIVHELGCLGGIFVILLFFALFLLGFLIAYRQRGDQAWIGGAAFRPLLATGASLILFIQALFIIGADMNFNVLSGVTLPFISAGGTSLLVSYSLVGLLFFCSLTEEQILGEEGQGEG